MDIRYIFEDPSSSVYKIFCYFGAECCIFISLFFILFLGYRRSVLLSDYIDGMFLVMLVAIVVA
jgi:hypothetical protein